MSWGGCGGWVYGVCKTPLSSTLSILHATTPQKCFPIIIENLGVDSVGHSGSLSYVVSVVCRASQFTTQHVDVLMVQDCHSRGGCSRYMKVASSSHACCVKMLCTAKELHAVEWRCYYMCLLVTFAHLATRALALQPPGWSSCQAMGWRSCKGTKVDWEEAQVYELAEAWKAGLPEVALQLVAENGVHANHICPLTSGCRGASRGDVENNFLWLKPVAELFPDSSPSSYFLADSMLALDWLLDNHIIDGNKEDAVKIGTRIRTCLGYARLLCRGSATSYSDKACMVLGMLFELGPTSKSTMQP